MISVLIPTYNYQIFPLVKEIHSQASDCNIPFQIVVLEDGSTKFMKLNKGVEKLNSVSYFANKTNLGRTKTRQKLAEIATYDTLLFLDADVMPRDRDFIKKFVKILPLQSDVVFGGITYTTDMPKENEILRWKYGKAREGKKISERVKMPQQSLISQAILIKREVFLKANDFEEKGYGLDVLFSVNLEKLNAEVLHICNPIIHLGLETSEKFLEKSKEGLKTLASLTKNKKISNDYRPIQKAYRKLEMSHAIALFEATFKRIEKRVVKNLLSKKPSLFLFDLYRLYYFSLFMK